MSNRYIKKIWRIKGENLHTLQGFTYPIVWWPRAGKISNWASIRGHSFLLHSIQADKKMENIFGKSSSVRHSYPRNSLRMCQKLEVAISHMNDRILHPQCTYSINSWGLLSAGFWRWWCFSWDPHCPVSTGYGYEEEWVQCRGSTTGCPGQGQIWCHCQGRAWQGQGKAIVWELGIVCGIYYTLLMKCMCPVTMCCPYIFWETQSPTADGLLGN